MQKGQKVAKEVSESSDRSLLQRVAGRRENMSSGAQGGTKKGADQGSR